MALQKIPFSVDSALLRELGERLVGKPHVALAELVKNCYDADARKVVVTFRPDEIEVSDNGHGMNPDEFKRFWMRIGNPHKQGERLSRKFGRPMSGSKGVGRLAVQFLGSGLKVETAPDDASGRLEATVDWNEAVNAGELTNAVAWWQELPVEQVFPDSGSSGTTVVVSGLNQEWSPKDFQTLAREIWFLQPPFKTNPQLTTDLQRTFEVVLKSDDPKDVEQFNLQMHGLLDIWDARLVGELIRCERSAGEWGTANKIVLSLEFSDGEQITKEYSVRGPCLNSLSFEIRIYSLHRRQPRGISVATARSYLNEFGGVHVYDSGFHLPYYGPETDWLGIEVAHSHRLSVSQLLPDHLNLAGGMSSLPTQTRMFGVVHVNTPGEQEAAAKQKGRRDRHDYLKVQVTRDRLADNSSYRSVKDIVRWSLDFYAMQEARRKLETAEAKRPVEPAEKKIIRVEEVLRSYRNDIPKTVFTRLESEVNEAVRATGDESELMRGRIGLLGSLATAGIAALAYEHEVYKQLKLLEDLSAEIKGLRIQTQSVRDRLNSVALGIDQWLERARRTHALFTPLLDEENRALTKDRPRARAVVEQIANQTGVLLRGAKVDTKGVADSLRLPAGSFAEWNAIFQNVIINAANAMIDSERRQISIRSRTKGKYREILVQDTGVGVDLSTADKLFEPFVRHLTVSRERHGLGLGGTGLGLTIVRMIAEALHCGVGFVEPDEGFKAAFSLHWNEQE